MVAHLVASLCSERAGREVKMVVLRAAKRDDLIGAGSGLVALLDAVLALVVLDMDSLSRLLMDE